LAFWEDGNGIGSQAWTPQDSTAGGIHHQRFVPDVNLLTGFVKAGANQHLRNDCILNVQNIAVQKKTFFKTSYRFRCNKSNWITFFRLNNGNKILKNGEFLIRIFLLKGYSSLRKV
jgi:hypothetical protein